MASSSSGRAASSGSRSVHGAAAGVSAQGGGLLAQLLQPRRQQELRDALPGRVGGLRRRRDGVRAGRVVLEPAAALLGLERPAGLRLSFLGPAQPPQSAAAVLRQRLLHRLERGEGERGRRRDRIRVQIAGLHQLQELAPDPLDVGRQRRPDIGGDGGDVGRVIQHGRPGRRDQSGLHRQGLGPAPVAARLAQPTGLLLPAVLARRRLTDRVGGGRGLSFALRPLLRGGTGLIAPGLLRAGLLPPPREVLRLDGGLLAQPFLKGLSALAVGQAGQLPAGLRADPGAAGPAQVDHVVAVLALAVGVQPDPVVAAPVRAGGPLHQAPPDQPPVRAGDQRLASGLLQTVGEPGLLPDRLDIEQAIINTMMI
ncbi:hypothetical protein [Streptomyces sp. x-80]|uniref:hypothetical protein n=1 Tax=Streptomyces sp. x-80 TaxID=2789282 RepID=UPI00397FA470